MQTLKIKGWKRSNQTVQGTWEELLTIAWLAGQEGRMCLFKNISEADIFSTGEGAGTSHSDVGNSTF